MRSNWNVKGLTPKYEKPKRSLMDRFWEKVDILTVDECWHWLGGLGTNGYGYIGLGGDRSVIAAHKLSFILHSRRLVADGLLVCHHCSNRKCVNPYHLFEGTYRDNLLQAYREGRPPPNRWGTHQHA